MIKFIVSAAAMVLPLSLLAPQAPAAPLPAAEGKTLEIRGEYGTSVHIPRGVERVRLTFRGQKGDAVLFDHQDGYQAACNVRLRHRSSTVLSWLDSIWRLPARGRYTVDYRCTPHVEGDVGVVKVRLTDVPVDGRSVVLRRSKNTAYVNAASVIVPRSGRVQVRSVGTAEYAWNSLLIKDAPAFSVAAWHQDYAPKAIYLAAGAPIANERGEMMYDRPLKPRAGERVVLIPDARRLEVRATTTRTVPGTLDGPPAPVFASVPFSEVGARFSSDGDQWVTATVGGSLRRRTLGDLALVGPEGQTLVGLQEAMWGPIGPLWYLPTAGRYRLLARTDPKHDAGDITLSSVRELDATMPMDGRPLAFTAQEPGEWVLAKGELGDEPYQLAAEGTSGTKWVAVAHASPFEQCRSSFCYDSGGFVRPPSTSSYGSLRGEGGWIFVVAFRAGQTGTVNVRVTPLRALPPPP